MTDQELGQLKPDEWREAIARMRYRDDMQNLTLRELREKKRKQQRRECDRCGRSYAKTDDCCPSCGHDVLRASVPELPSSDTLRFVSSRPSRRIAWAIEEGLFPAFVDLTD